MKSRRVEMMDLRGFTTRVVLALLVMLVSIANRGQAQVTIKIEITTTVDDISPDQGAPSTTSTAGRVNGLASNADGSVYYAATELAGLYKSTDGGVTWQYIDTHSPYVTWDVAVANTSPETVYATSFYDGRADSRAGINISTNGGVDWHTVSLSAPSPGFCDDSKLAEPSAMGIAIDPNDPHRVAIGTNCGLAITVGPGLDDWMLVDPSPEDEAGTVWDVVIHHGGIIDVVADDGHFRLPGPNASWIGYGFLTQTHNASTIAASPDDPDILFAIRGLQIWQTADGGESWSQMTYLSKNGRIPFVLTNQRSGSGFDVWFGDKRLYRGECGPPPPTPNGKSCLAYPWLPGNLIGNAHPDVGDLLFDPTAPNDACPLVFSNDGGIHINTKQSGDACQAPGWVPPDLPPHALWLYTIDGWREPNGDNVVFIGTQDNGIFSTGTPEANAPAWVMRLSADVFDITATPTAVAFTVYDAGNGGQLWLGDQLLYGKDPLDLSLLGKIPSFVYQKALVRFGQNQWALLTDEGVWMTNDLEAPAQSWTAVGPASFPAWGSSWASLQVAGLQVAEAPGGPYFFLLKGGGWGFTPDSVYRYDGTWTPVAPPGGEGGFGVFAVDPRDPDRMIASHLRPSQNPQMVMTTNGGANWTNLVELDALMTGNGEFKYRNRWGPGQRVWKLDGYVQPTLVAFDPQDSRIVVAGSADAGPFISTDAGKTWRRIGNFIWKPTPPMTRSRKTYFYHGMSTSLSEHVYIYLATRGRGVFRVRTKVPQLLIYDVCKMTPLCYPIEVQPPFRFVLRPRAPDHIILDPIVNHCSAIGRCPGVRMPDGSAPFFNLFLDGLDSEAWEVVLYTSDGELSPHQVVSTDRGVVLSFRPDESRFREGLIGDYQLAFALKPGARPSVHQFTSRLEAGREPYRPGPGEEVIF